ncbi:hypothetical protein ABK040_009001 [Willaertia magna]
MSKEQQITLVNIIDSVDKLCTSISCNFQYKIKQVASGNGYILILTYNGHLYFKGELQDLNYPNYFVKIDNKIENVPSTIKFIASSENFILLIDHFHKIFIYGDFGTKIYDKFTEIGMIEKNDEIKFISSGSEIVIIVTQNNKLIVVGFLQPFNGTEKYGFIKMGKLPFQEDIKDLQCGYYHTIVLDYNGNIYGSGDNTGGQLGLSKVNIAVLKNLTQLNVPFKVKKIATAPEGTLLLNYHNELYGSGENSAFQLGLSSRTTIYEFTKIILSNVCNENNDLGRPVIIKKLFKTERYITIILTENDGFYFTGLLIYNGFRKLKEINGCEDWKYNYAVQNLDRLNNNIYVFQTNYKINKKQKRKVTYFKQLLSARNNKLLSDVVIVCLSE